MQRYTNKPSHEIVVLSVLRKLILQRYMCSHPVGLDVWFLVGPFIYFHTSVCEQQRLWWDCMHARLRGCAGSPEPSLVAYVISTTISWAVSNVHVQGQKCLLNHLRSNFYDLTVPLILFSLFINWTAPNQFGTYRLCEQRRFRRACASAQSRQNLRCSLIQAVNQEELSDRKPDPWPLRMAGHVQLKFVMTECSKTQICLTRSNLFQIAKNLAILPVDLKNARLILDWHGSNVFISIAQLPMPCFVTIWKVWIIQIFSKTFCTISILPLINNSNSSWLCLFQAIWLAGKKFYTSANSMSRNLGTIFLPQVPKMYNNVNKNMMLMTKLEL